VQLFVNTRDVDERTDELADSGAASAWLGAHGLAGAGERPLRRPDVERLLEVREALRELLLANNGEPATLERARHVVNRAASRAALVVSLDHDGRVLLQPAAGTTVDRALAVILGDVYTAMHEGTWPRLKACREGTCQWAFYDHSKNRSGAWCSMAVCGNRAKARTFRLRH